MSEMMKKNVDNKPVPAAQNPIFEHPLNTSEWEKRISEARLQREKVLSERAANPTEAAQKPRKPAVKQTVIEGPSASDLHQSTTKSKFPDSTRKTGDVSDKMEPPREGSEAPQDVIFATRRAQTHVKGSKLALFSVPNWLKVTGKLKPFYLLTCSAGFGFGFALGVGAIVAVGWSLLPSRTSAVVGNDAALEMGSTTAVLENAQIVSVVPINDVAVVGSPFADIVSGLPVEQNSFETSVNISLPKITPITFKGLVEHEQPPVAQPVPFAGGPELLGKGLVEAGESTDAAATELSFFVHAPESVSDNALQDYVAQFETAGYPVAKIGREKFRVSATHLRFYNPDNAAKAQAIASDLGFEAKDFSQEGNGSARIEFWLAGTSLEAANVEEQDDRKTKPGYFARLRTTQAREQR